MLDDEKLALDLLIHLISDRKDLEVVGAYTNPLEMLEDVTRLMPDLILMDIEMPGMNGLGLAVRLLELQEDIEIVFVTAYPQYAVEAFRVNAVDYLLKPVDPEFLNHALERVLKRKMGITAAKAAKADSRIVCFGGFEIFKAGYAEPIRFPTVKAEELFAYLLVHRKTNISKWTLCDNLWPEVTSTDKVEHNLHVTMHRMKKTLRDSGIEVRISSQRGFYRMECDVICDYVMFEQAVAHTMYAENGESGIREVFNKAYYLYKGPLFANKDYAWCEAERERMSRYFASLSKRKAKWHFEQRRYPQAAEVLLTLLNQLPFDEEAHELLLRTYKDLQDRTAFLSHYEKMKHSFMEELGAEPPEALQQMLADIRK